MGVQKINTGKANQTVNTTTVWDRIAALETKYQNVPEDVVEKLDELTNKTKDVNQLNKSKVKLNKGFVAHRGFQGRAPENTLKAVAEAGRLGFRMVELDPQLTSDGYWILSHDNTVDRMTDGTGTISSMTLTQIQSLKVDSPTSLINSDEVFRIPLLDDVLKECAYWGMGVNLDGTKFTVNQANVTSLLNLLDKYDLTDKSFIMCNVTADRLVVKQYAPNLGVGWIGTPANIDIDIVDSANYKNTFIGYTVSVITDAMIEKCNDNGVHIYGYAANDTKSAYMLLNKGVTFIETDNILAGGIF